VIDNRKGLEIGGGAQEDRDGVQNEEHNDLDRFGQPNRCTLCPVWGVCGLYCVCMIDDRLGPCDLGLGSLAIYRTRVPSSPYIGRGTWGTSQGF